MNGAGKTGCGCLIFLLAAFLVAIGLFMHPVTLKFLAQQLKYEDKIFPAEAIFVPRFQEDRKGELYGEAFKEFLSGNGKAIWVEDEKILGVSVADLVAKTAKPRGIKEEYIKRLETSGEGQEKVNAIRGKFQAMGFNKVILVVPDYASRQFHLLYEPGAQADKTAYLVKSVPVSFFRKDLWWKDAASRTLFLREVVAVGTCYFDSFKSGWSKK